MGIYLASSLRNHLLNACIAQMLRDAGLECFLPQEVAHCETDSTSSGTDVSTCVFKSNVHAIDQADAVIVVAQLLGTDTAWECGYAISRGKCVILLESELETVREMYMVYGSIDAANRVSLTSYTAEAVRSSLHRIVSLLR